MKVKPQTLSAKAAEDAVNKAPPIGDPVGFIDENELCRRLKISRGSAINYRRAGLLPFIKLRHRVLFDWENVRSALLRHQIGGNQ